MLNPTREIGSERVLIACANGTERRYIGEIAKLAKLRAVGFIRQADEVAARTRLSRPDVLLLDAEFLRQLHNERARLDVLHLHTGKTVLFGRKLSKTMTAQWKASGFHGSLDLSASVEKDQSAFARDLRVVLNGHIADPDACAVVPVPLRTTPILRQRKVLPPSCVVIGSSTGGPVALLAVLKALPANFPLPIAVVQHMPPGFTSMLAERLNVECSLRVVEAQDGMPFTSGSVFIAPGGSHMIVEGTAQAPRIGVTAKPPENSCRPSVDVLFRSAANVFRGNQHAIVLTGMGRDGLNGARELHELGSRIVVQDAATSTVWGMPGAIAQAGYADDILPLDQIAPQLLRCL